MRAKRLLTQFAMLSPLRSPRLPARASILTNSSRLRVSRREAWCFGARRHLLVGSLPLAASGSRSVLEPLSCACV